MAVPYTPVTRSEVADFGTSDHAFSFPEGARMVRFYTPGGLTTPAAVIRMLDDDADLTLQLPEGTEYLAGAVTHVRNTGTTTGVIITGFA